MKTIGIAGGDGFVGRHLAKNLLAAGYNVIILSRSSHQAKGKLQYARWDAKKQYMDTEALSKMDAMVNLAGAGVVDKRWTPAYKQEIMTSRTDAGSFLIGQLQQHAPDCKVYVAASAIGIYGPDEAGKPPFTEESAPYHDFLADVCKAWEATSAKAAASFRTAILRFGIVLGRESGAYPQLAGPQQFGVKPILGGGRQMVSWVHVEDVAAMLQRVLESADLQGIYNCVAPVPVTHKTIMDTIAHAKRGVRIPVQVPGLLLRVVLGGSSIEVLKSCTVSAGKIQAAGFAFKFPRIQDAVTDLEA